eukprot:355458-Chlamydomonas_euryale.AAC.2
MATRLNGHTAEWPHGKRSPVLLDSFVATLDVIHTSTLTLAPAVSQHKRRAGARSSGWATRTSTMTPTSNST